MALVSSLSAPVVEFPSSESHLSSLSSDIQYQRPQYLPFRRISLPSAPNLAHRQSIVSTASFDSLPEEPTPILGSSASPLSKGSDRPGPKHRPSSVEISRKAARRRSARTADAHLEAKRRRVITEFCETERTYVEGLELIHMHFLTPIIASLDTPLQILSRSELTSIFSNFIDIWNLHRSFYSSITAFVDTATSPDSRESFPPLSPILLAHFPYLSLYTPFVTSFSDAIDSCVSLQANNPAFGTFIARQEADPRCGRLKFRDWLLTIVQRCPRYLLLLKDMISCTDPEDPEYASLMEVQALVSKITQSLNTSLHVHTQTLSLLALQRNTINLPFKLITPGRTFIKRALLLQLEGSTAREREFLLFSDSLVWLANADGDFVSDKWDYNFVIPSDGGLSPFSGKGVGKGGRPVPMVRTRSKSDADIHQAAEAFKRRESILKFKIIGHPKKKTRHASSGTDDRWVYKGHVDLIDLDVVVSPSREASEERRIECLSPHGSFAIYAASEEERDQWITAIRNAKESLLISLNVTHPNSTLTSSASTQHLRRTLEAVPYSPDDNAKKPKRGKVDHFVPAIWIPDGKTEGCMRCGRTFGWRRRRHHCRLCGRCVCGSCSGRTFFILDTTAKESHKPARACDTCYDTVFPVIDPVVSSGHLNSGTTHSHFTLSSLLSMPSLQLSDSGSPSALMTFKLGSPKRSDTPRRAPGLPRIEDEPTEGTGEGPSSPAIRLKYVPRPRSYIQILEDFQEHASPQDASGSPLSSRYGGQIGDDGDPDERDEDVFSRGGGPSASTTPASSVPPSPRKENTARRHKRFSLPAVALHTSPVTTRSAVVGDGKGRRVSLVLGRSSAYLDGQAGMGQYDAQRLKAGAAVGKLSEILLRGGGQS